MASLFCLFGHCERDALCDHCKKKHAREFDPALLQTDANGVESYSGFRCDVLRTWPAQCRRFLRAFRLNNFNPGRKKGSSRLLRKSKSLHLYKATKLFERLRNRFTHNSFYYELRDFLAMVEAVGLDDHYTHTASGDCYCACEEGKVQHPLSRINDRIESELARQTHRQPAQRGSVKACGEALLLFLHLLDVHIRSLVALRDELTAVAPAIFGDEARD